MSPSWIDFFLKVPGGEPCLGVVLGRKSLWAAQTRKGGAGTKVEGAVQRTALPAELFTGAPSPDTVSQLSNSLRAVLQNSGKAYLPVQVALPDPAVKAEVFELDKVPSGKKAMADFLKWRFKAGPKDGGGSPSFATQLLGEEGGKSLLLGMALEQTWREAVLQAFRQAGAFVSVMDMAACHRVNFYLGEFQKKAAGSALLAFDPEYWSLAILDKGARLRFVRSKWWNREAGKVKDIPLGETLAEVERTIRSYVYAAKERSVEALYVTAPPDWLKPIVEAVDREVEGGCVGLSPGQVIPGFKGEEEASTSALATAVRR